jgi:peptidoglycan/LPS O-acetylase OafA/YrhL
MRRGRFLKLFLWALLAAGVASAVFGMTRDEQPFGTRLITVAGIFAMLLASCVLSHLSLLRQIARTTASEQQREEDEAQLPTAE